MDKAREEEIRAARIKWGLCPDCGLNLEHPVVADYHARDQCPAKGVTKEKTTGGLGQWLSQ